MLWNIFLARLMCSAIGAMLSLLQLGSLNLKKLRLPFASIRDLGHRPEPAID